MFCGRDVFYLEQILVDLLQVHFVIERGVFVTFLWSSIYFYYFLLACFLHNLLVSIIQSTALYCRFLLYIMIVIFVKECRFS